MKFEIELKQKWNCIIKVRKKGTNTIQIEWDENPKLGGALMVSKSQKQKKNPMWVLSSKREIRMGKKIV